MTENEMLELLDQFEKDPSRQNRRRFVEALRNTDWGDYRAFRNRAADWLRKNTMATNGN